MIVTVSNQKGGVGKTTIAVQLAMRAAETGKRTLLVDLDAQGNATRALTGDPHLHEREEGTALDLWYPERMLQPVETQIDGIDVLAAYDGFDCVDDNIEEGITALRRLKQLSDYAYIVIDTPPAPGPRQIGPQAISDVVLAPVEPQAFSYDGLANLAKVFGIVREANPDVTMRVVLNKLRPGVNSHIEIYDALREAVGDLMLPEVLGEREVVNRAVLMAKPVWKVAPKDKAAQAWRTMCSTVLDLSVESVQEEQIDA